jgi:hypothetical protein
MPCCTSQTAETQHIQYRITDLSASDITQLKYKIKKKLCLLRFIVVSQVTSQARLAAAVHLLSLSHLYHPATILPSSTLQLLRRRIEYGIPSTTQEHCRLWRRSRYWPSNVTHVPRSWTPCLYLVLDPICVHWLPTFANIQAVSSGLRMSPCNVSISVPESITCTSNGQLCTPLDLMNEELLSPSNLMRNKEPQPTRRNPSRDVCQILSSH